MSGTWAAYTTIPVEWERGTVVSPGTGTVQVWSLIRRTSIGTFAADIGQLCGIVLPLIGSVLNEINGLRFVDSIERLPQFQIIMTMNAPESTFTTDPAAVVFGVNLGNPVGDPWPRLAQLVASDDDLDGLPGVTTPVEKGPRFGDPLVGFDPAIVRANVLQLASRSVVVTRGSVQSCDELRGELEVPTIDGKPALDGAIVGCLLSDTDEPCSPSQVEFIDANAPRLRPTAGAMLVQRRVRDDVTYGDVRGMYPALPSDGS